MLLVIDAGNTNITIGTYKKDELLFVSRLATDRKATKDQLAISLKSIFSLNCIKAEQFRGAIICSVVPEITQALSEAVTILTGSTPLIVGPGIKTGINIKIDNPSELGADLVADAVGAISKYQLPCLILDLGTASKISVVGEDGAYLGCTISPGVKISLGALAEGASQLSQISLIPPTHTIGTNTADSIRAGIVYGTADMLDGLCDRIETELGTKISSIIATGGLSSIAKHCKHDIIFDDNLLLFGLKTIFEKNQK
ncbi:MAG: type III pantothenate kinase [Oscillospiraceae bacterium]|nr:type III pantothenate kinase [Oscillospiraceae bacterium]